MRTPNIGLWQCVDIGTWQSGCYWPLPVCGEINTTAKIQGAGSGKVKLQGVITSDAKLQGAASGQVKLQGDVVSDAKLKGTAKTFQCEE